MNSHRQNKTIPFGMILAALLVLVLVWQAVSGAVGGAIHPNREEIEANVERLKSLEAAPAAPAAAPEGAVPGGLAAATSLTGEISGSTLEAQETPAEETAASSTFDINSEEEKERIMNLEGVGRTELYQWFTGKAAIIGDSITHSIVEYEWLDESVVFAKIGLLVVRSDDYVSGAIAADPEAVFFSFGSNDIESYEGQVSTFIDNYRPRVQRVKDALPGAKIFICALFPVADYADIPAYVYMEDYNNALQEMCREMNLTYLDAGFILDRDPELYDADGIHPVSRFYPLWLTYLADAAGISDR